jgi:hypothetical protein
MVASIRRSFTRFILYVARLIKSVGMSKTIKITAKAKSGAKSRLLVTTLQINLLYVDDQTILPIVSPL